MEKQKDLQNELLNTISELLDDSNINSVLILVRKTARFLISLKIIYIIPFSLELWDILPY